MKIFLLLMFFSSICLSGDFYYLKNKDGWTGPYESNEIPSNADLDCKALIDISTKIPIDKKLMKKKQNGAELNCDNNGFSQLKNGKDLSDANKEIDDDRIKENTKKEVMKNIDIIVLSLKAIVCKDHPTEDLCK